MRLHCILWRNSAHRYCRTRLVVASSGACWPQPLHPRGVIALLRFQQGHRKAATKSRLADKATRVAAQLLLLPSRAPVEASTWAKLGRPRSWISCAKGRYAEDASELIDKLYCLLSVSLVGCRMHVHCVFPSAYRNALFSSQDSEGVGRNQPGPSV